MVPRAQATDVEPKDIRNRDASAFDIQIFTPAHDVHTTTPPSLMRNSSVRLVRVLKEQTWPVNVNRGSQLDFPRDNYCEEFSEVSVPWFDTVQFDVRGPSSPPSVDSNKRSK